MPDFHSRPVSALQVAPRFHIPCGAFSSYPGPLVATTMADKPPTSHLRALIKSAAPKFAGADLEPVPSARPQVHFFATASDADVLMLSLSPRPTGLLRSERLLILSEALLLQWLSGPATETWPTHANDAAPHQTSPAARAKSIGNSHISRRPCRLLQQFLPRLVEHGMAGSATHGEYILTRPVAGTVIAALANPLGRAERKSVDFQVGQLLRRISSQQSPNGKFGTAIAVLSSESTAPTLSRRRAAVPDHHLRHDRWSEAFLSLLEAALRDAEDFKVAIQYAAVRDQVSRFTRFLDAVTSPRLVAIDAGEDTSTLVSPHPGPRVHENRQQNNQCIQPDGRRHDDSAFDTDINRTSRSMAHPERESIQVTGLRHWGNCIFGDPLLASVLSRNASPEIWDGFQSPLRDHEFEVPDMQPQPLEDLRNAGVRRLLYECHHAVTAIVREYCRQCDDSDDREMPARRRLTQALRTLDSLDDSGKEKRPHPSGEMSPAKRPKSDGGGAG
ncbi:hypothetical protein HRG_011066 [Hirsutella rhossiliensis]|uniref:Uncharacterized protein n=1 Tax=Hirsutella rhossiliensis TaxID=111463 RepID=A0A9P8MKG4_9HYPO|nr:uncharacterized protein HRG_11066 [Hirsutella rhossiliensis]KAH0957973.1 hypothetical protein HRG_11066 [Hirsutella rhossiliensis]